MKSMVTATDRTRHRQGLQALPIRFWVGVILIAVWWPIAWMQVRPFSDFSFFPLWLGFVLVVDSVVYFRTATSLIDRAGWRVVSLFILSAPLWWLFEGFNKRLGNWIYHLPDAYGVVEYALRATLPFATVVPAVFVATELVRSFGKNPLSRLPTLILTRRTLLLLHAAGWVMVVAVLLVPKYAFPLVWLSLFFIIDPLATLAGGRSIGSYIRSGDWSPVFNIAAGTLLCGFFWEMWNLYSFPKWTYSVPYVDFLHIFEMPVLGYGGYIPFGWEIFSIYALLNALFPALRLPGPKVSNIELN